ncbi:uncharacterized protein NEMAJ01_0229 [Nematocida major]|uniref:uncharacterized protein n=1 Tax=Nematocida major TaxID=1912982 RepID=UPI002007E37D|nr:uncharacterized protein NEMAJ01_0229 [Nematocida major]KAH9385333.1 hypothetical protein NEMAJ01_0229 [Nematocida major]
MAESRDSRDDSSPRLDRSYERSERHRHKAFHSAMDEKHHTSPQPFRGYQEKSEYEERPSEEYTYTPGKDYRYSRSEDYQGLQYDRPSSADMSPRTSQSPHMLKENTTREGGRMYAQPFTGRQFRSNSVSGGSLLSLGQEMEREKIVGFHSPHTPLGGHTSPRVSGSPIESITSPLHQGPGGAPMSSLRFFRRDDMDESLESDDEGSRASKGRKKIKMEFIKDKGRRGVTFSKRKKGIMKKAYELNVLTKCEILLVVASETGHVYTFATPKLQPIIKQHENLIQQYLNTPYMNEVHRIYDTAERYPPDTSGYYKSSDSYGYDRTPRGSTYPSGYYHNGYDTDSSPGNAGSRL